MYKKEINKLNSSVKKIEKLRVEIGKKRDEVRDLIIELEQLADCMEAAGDSLYEAKIELIHAADAMSELI